MLYRSIRSNRSGDVVALLLSLALPHTPTTLAATLICGHELALHCGGRASVRSKPTQTDGEDRSMGNIIGRLFQDVPKEARLLVVGLDGVGKTTVCNQSTNQINQSTNQTTIELMHLYAKQILYRLRLGEIGTSFEAVSHRISRTLSHRATTQ